MSEKPKKKILLIDDEDDFREILKARLIFEGFDVIDAPDGAKGLNLILNERPDLVLLDLMMPEMTGYQVWTQLHKMKELHQIPILILTAKSHATDKFWGASMSAYDYITK